MLRILLFVFLLPLFAQGAARDRHGWDVDILSDTFGFDATTPSDYPWDDLIQACPHRDCIPAIDKPQFVAAAQATFLSADDIVIALELGGEARAYPVRILVRHELVNDRSSDSLWQQITGTAFAGPKRKQELRAIPSSMTTWSQWRFAHPDTRIHY